MKHVHMRLNELLIENDISKNRICKDLDLPRGNFNRYCRDDFQRIDANLIIKLCDYFDCRVLLLYRSYPHSTKMLRLILHKN